MRARKQINSHALDRTSYKAVYRTAAVPLDHYLAAPATICCVATNINPDWKRQDIWLGLSAALAGLYKQFYTPMSSQIFASNPFMNVVKKSSPKPSSSSRAPQAKAARKRRHSTRGKTRRS